jgi:hypothetical protein
VPSDSWVSGVGVKLIVCPVAWICPAPVRPARGAGGPVRSAVDGSAERVPVARVRVSVAALDAWVRGRSDRLPPAVGDALAVRGPLGVRVLLALLDFDFAAPA